MASVQILTRVTDERQVMQSGVRLGEYFGRLSDRRVYDAMDNARAELSIPAPPPSYPIKWQTEKQRRAFFATDGFGRGIPTPRTGAYTQGFRVQKVELRAYRLINRVGYSGYVGGRARGQDQSSIHAGRWPKIFDVIQKWSRRLLDVVGQDLSRVIRNEGIGL